jgi:hypothetical protein
MKTIAGSILVLAGAVLLQPAARNHHQIDEALVFATPFLLAGIILMIVGLRSDS